MVIEESFEAPEFDAESQTEFSEVQNQIAKLQPEMELAREQTRKATAELRESLCSQREQLREQAEKMRQEFTPQLREELEKSRQKLQQKWNAFGTSCRATGLDNLAQYPLDHGKTVVLAVKLSVPSAARDPGSFRRDTVTASRPQDPSLRSG